MLAGEQAKSGQNRAAGPPTRPPPPKIHGSPAPGVIKASSKSAFDDLNDTILEAFGGSPSKSFGAVGSQVQRQPVAGSSSQQHAFAPDTHLFSSPVKGASNVNSSIGGGSL